MILICVSSLSFMVVDTAFADPQVQIQSPIGGKYAKGKPIEIKFEVWDAPTSASVGFYLEKDIAKESQSFVPGRSGPLSMKAQNVTGSMKGSFTWDGESFGCSPTDAPTLCREAAEPGKYFIRAQLFNRTDAALVGIRRAHDDPEVPLLIAETKSNPFEITGAVNLRPVESMIEGGVLRYLVKTFQLFYFSDTNLSRYYEAVSQLSGPDASGNYCRDYIYKRPFAGMVTVCSPNVFDQTLVQIRGSVGVAPGCESYSAAKSKAMDLAKKPYLKRLRSKRDSGLQLSTGIDNWSYREDGGYWIFVVQMLAAGGSAQQERFADKVIVKVGKNKACVVRTVKYSGGYYGNIHFDRYDCPGRVK